MIMPRDQHKEEIVIMRYPGEENIRKEVNNQPVFPEYRYCVENNQTNERAKCQKGYLN
jgi:hypothetical protein